MRLGLGLTLGMTTDAPPNDPPTDIAWGGSHSVAEDAALGTVVGTTLSATDPELDSVTFTLVDDANGFFDIIGDEVIVSGVLDYESATSHDITVRASDGNNFYDETFSVTVTDVDETPPDDPLPDDSDVIIVDDGTFTNPPIVTVVDGAVKLHGKKASGSSGKFIFSIGALQAGYRYTMQYDPDFSLMTLQGKKALVGFGFKEGNDFRLTGLKGDGSTGLHAYEVSGDGLWNQTSGFTVDDGGAAQNGTQAGPNWLQLDVSDDGETYTLRSSADGDAWDDEFTDVVPDPFSDVTSPTQSGIAVFFDGTDTGSFSIAITLWTAGPALWSPSDLGAPLLAWYKADTIAGSNGDPQGTFIDSSGNGFNATSPTEGARPTLAAADLNSKNTLRFTIASSQFYELPNIFASATAASMYCVLKSFADPADHGTYGNFGSGISGHWGYADGEVYDNFGSTTRPDCGNPTPSLASYRIASVWSAANDRGILIDGNAFFSSGTNTVGFTATPWMGRGGAYFNGWIAEMILTDAKQSTDDRQKAEGYLAHKWGLTGSLDAGHPYKTDPPEA